MFLGLEGGNRMITVGKYSWYGFDKLCLRNDVKNIKIDGYTLSPKMISE